MIRYESDSLDLRKWLETLPGKRETRQKRVKRENLPFLPRLHGKISRRSLARASPRGRKARTFGKIARSGVRFRGGAKKVLLPGLGPVPAAVGAESSTLWARKSPFLKWLTKLSGPGGKRGRSGLAEAAEEGQETGQRSEARGAFVISPEMKWLSR